MLIYANGDSFVAGVELGDDILVDYPGCSKPNDSSKLKNSKEWIAKTYNPEHHYFQNRQEKFQEVNRLEFERAFPSILSKKYNLKTVNHALGGSSMDRIVRSSMADLINLSQTHDNIVAIIGTTCPSRFEVPNWQENLYNDFHGHPKVWSCISSTYYMSDREPAEPLIDYQIRYEKDYHMAVKFLKNIITLQDFCTVNKIKLYWLSTNSDFSSFNIEPKYSDFYDLRYIQKYADYKPKFSMYNLSNSEELRNKEIICPSGHYGTLLHEHLADLIYSTIRERV